ncbi:hypothetical protein HPB48_018813 [Haemaphysalis longicornis]|uniref:Uncharacterized protein n=1 Tax=Haemaphysalis longicornis TaxID=44386 RepID=A0A9J6FY32_HAELO|nr:hypothetical protein HPB48_018813 [Haemaphysalis longicornis]
MEPTLEKRQIRILGMVVQSNARADETIARLKKMTLQLAKIVHRLTEKRNGMREEDTLRLVISRIAYSLPYHNLTK